MPSVWSNLDPQQREDYTTAIKAIAMLAPLFRQKARADEKDKNKAAYIPSKFQETVFAEFFKGTVVDRGNQPYDVMLPSTLPNKNDLVGIKTFMFDSNSMQKVMQFKSIATSENWAGEYLEKGDYVGLAKRVSTIRNNRLKSAQAQLAGAGKVAEEVFGNIYYHFLSPSKDGVVHVGETDYSYTDIEAISVNLAKASASSFTFTDGKHFYKYTPADSTLYMKFEHNKSKAEDGDIVDQFTTEPSAKPFELLLALLGTKAKETTAKSDTIAHPQDTTPADAGSVEGLKPDKLESETNKLFELDKSLEEASREELEPSKTCVVFPIFNLSRRGGVLPGQVPPKSGFNVRLGAPKNKGSDTRRPKHEMYLPVPQSKAFHAEYPGFFGVRDGSPISTINEDGSYLHKRNRDRSFKLTLIPSGVTLTAYLTGDNLKQIMSIDRQTDLGPWILEDVFQLADYELLDRKKLDELNLDCVRYTRLGNRHVGVEFIKATDEDLHNLWPRQKDDFLALKSVQDDDSL